MRRIARNPLALIDGKQLVGQADADAIALPLLVSLDAAKRGLAPASLCNTITQHILTAVTIWARMGNKPLYTEAVKAWAAMVKACALSPAKEFRALFGIARLIGMDKNAAAISANHGTNKLTGTNMLALMGATHLPTPTQEICYTPTELGSRRCMSAKMFNRVLADYGLQERIGGRQVLKAHHHGVGVETHRGVML